MIQVQFRIKCGEDVDIETDLLEREDANENERSIAREIEGMTEAVLTAWAESIGKVIEHERIHHPSNAELSGGEAVRSDDLLAFYEAVAPFLRRLREPRFDREETNDYVCGSTDCKNALDALAVIEANRTTTHNAGQLAETEQHQCGQ